MTRAELMTSLTDGLRKLLKGYSLPSRVGGQEVMQEVKVFAQYLPQPSGITFADKAAGIKNYTSDDFTSNFPCVIVKLGEMADTEEQAVKHSNVKVTLLLGVYDETPECQGYMDILNLQEMIRKSLLEERILARKFVLRMPLTCALDDSDTWPVYFGTMAMTYELARPVRSSGYVYRYGQS